MEVLQLDMSGRPQSWISAREAAILYASDGVAWTLGQAFYVLRGTLASRNSIWSARMRRPRRIMSSCRLGTYGR